MGWKTFGIKTKLLASYGMLLALLALVGVWSLVGIGQTVKDGSEVILSNQLRSEILQRQVDHLNWAASVSKFVYDDGMTTLAAQPDPHQCAFGKWYYGDGRAAAQAELPALAPLLASIEGPHAALHQSAADIAKARAAGDNEAVRRLFTTTTQANLGQVQEILKNISKTTDEHLVSPDDMMAHAKRFRLVVSILVLAALPLGVFMAFFAARGIVTPLSNIASFSQKIADGDLTSRLAADGKDEIGTLSRALNDMGDNLQRMFSKVSTGVSTLTSSSSRMKNLAGQMSQSVASTSQKALMLAQESESLAMNVMGVTSAMEQSSVNVQSVATATDEMTATLLEITKNAANSQAVSEQAVQTMLQLQDNVKTLGDASQEIGKVTKTITDISNQTKLLALNATIEAARAGEAGKGFAVVAGEIKELARQTANATQEIAQKIADIQNSTGQTLSGISEVSDVIIQVNGNMLMISAAMEEQSVTTSEIARNVGELSSAVSDVTGQLTESSQAVCNMMSDLIEVSTFAQECDALTTDMTGNTEVLSELSEDLSAETGKYKSS